MYKRQLKDGYLTIQATTDSSRDEKDSNGTYIRRERYCGSCSRSFYVGDAVTQEDILSLIHILMDKQYLEDEAKASDKSDDDDIDFDDLSFDDL